MCRLPSYCSGSGLEERDNTITFPFCGTGPRSSMRVKRHIWTINVRVGPGHRPRLNSCLSFSMARSAILEFIFPRCYFPCVPGSPQRTFTPTYAVRLDPSCALSHRASTFFHIWFSQTKYFNSVPLISTRWIKGGRLVSQRTSSRGIRAHFKEEKKVAMKVAFKLLIRKEKKSCYCE